MIKTVILSGTEQAVEGLEKNNTLVINNSSTSVYASNKSGVIPYTDGVIEIPAGGCDTVVGTNGTVYVLGMGRVELRGVEYIDMERASSPDGSGEGTVDVTKAYVDEQCTAVLKAAKTYADEEVNATKVVMADTEKVKALFLGNFVSLLENVALGRVIFLRRYLLWLKKQQSLLRMPMLSNSMSMRVYQQSATRIYLTIGISPTPSTKGEKPNTPVLHK